MNCDTCDGGHLEEISTLPCVDELLQSLDLTFTHDDLVTRAADVVPVLCGVLASASTIDATKRTKVTIVGELLRHLLDVCPPKELFIILLEQADAFKDDVVYFSLLQPIRDCIRKLPSKQHLSLAIAMETLCAHVVAVSTVPPELPAECIESLPIYADETTTKIAAVISAFIGFVESFAMEVSAEWHLAGENGARLESMERQMADITRQILKILGCSLFRINLHVQTTVDEHMLVENACRECAERCVKILVAIHPNIIKLIDDIVLENAVIESRQIDREKHRQSRDSHEPQNDDDDEDMYNVEEPISEVGLAVLVYLVFGERFGTDALPQVYRHRFIFESNLRFISTLLDSSQPVTTIDKGITLCSSLLANIESATLDASLFECEQMRKVVEGIVRAMTSSSVKSICQSSVQLLSSLVAAFDADGRRRTIEFLLLESSSFSGSVHGHAILLLKNEIDRCFRFPNETAQLRSFSGLLRRVFVTPHGGFRSNLLTPLGDRIMGALNLLRYLILRDAPTKNQTGVWDLINAIDDGFLRPLRDGVQLLRGDIHSELKDLELQQCGGISAASDLCTMELKVGNECLGDLSIDQKRSTMHSALISLDMMDSVQCRVDEIVNGWRHSQQSEKQL